MAHEGSSDGLRNFLNKHKKKLKNVDAVYRDLTENDMDEEELMNICEVDLRETLNEIGMKKIQIGRMISVLRCCGGSTIHSESMVQGNPPDVYGRSNSNNNAPQLIILSREEQESLSTIKTKSESISVFLPEIDKALQELQDNSSKNEHVINNKFDEIIENINKRRSHLSNQCKKIGNEKQIALNKQMDILTKYHSELSKFHETSQAMLRDPKADPSKRRDTIIDGSNALLNKNSQLDNDVHKLAANPSFQVIIDVTSITQIAKTAGLIQDDDVQHHTFHPGQECQINNNNNKVTPSKPSKPAAVSSSSTSSSTSGNTKTIRNSEKEQAVEKVENTENVNDVNEIHIDPSTGLPKFKDVGKYKVVLSQYVSEKGWKSAKETLDRMDFNDTVIFQCTIQVGRKGKEKTYKGIGDSNKTVAIGNAYCKAVAGAIPKSKAFELMTKYLPSFTKKGTTKNKKETPVAAKKTEQGSVIDDGKMRFDVIQKQFENYLIRNGNGFKRDAKNDNDSGINMTCASSQGIKSGDVCSFSIELKSSDDYGAIGIASKIDCIGSGKMGWIRSDKDFGNTYFIVGKGKIMSGAETTAVTSQRYGIPKLKANDVVTINVDCKKWTVRFLVNNKLVGKQVNITKNCTYYPVICTQSKNKEYVIVKKKNMQ